MIKSAIQFSIEADAPGNYQSVANLEIITTPNLRVHDIIRKKISGTFNFTTGAAVDQESVNVNATSFTVYY